jgi:hypothetical protein
MSNVALAINAIEGMTFAVGRGGDYIDSGAASSIGASASKMCVIKESGIDLLNPQGREQEAIAFYYRHHIEYTLKKIAEQFARVSSQVTIPHPIPLIVSGGTSRAGNFLTLFEQELNKMRKRFPIQISEVRHAEDPMNAVALGLLVQAMQEHDD